MFSRENLRRGEEVLRFTQIRLQPQVAERDGDEVSLELSDSSTVRLSHKCADFNCAVIGTSLVALTDIDAIEPLTVNCNQFLFAIDDELCFECTCHQQQVEGYSMLPAEQRMMLNTIVDEPVRIDAVAKFGALDFCPPSPMVSLKPNESGVLNVVASQQMLKNTVVWTCNGLVLPFPQANTVALSGSQHLRLIGEAEYLWHSCEPNVRFVVRGDGSMHVLTTKTIEEGESLRYNYLTTEWEIAQPFSCNCGSKRCFGNIRGFKYLTESQRRQLAPECTPAVLEQATVDPQPVLQRRNANAPNCAEIDLSGRLVASAPLTEGQIILHPELFEIRDRALVCDELREIPHSCDANTVYVEGRVVARHVLEKGTPLTINLSLIRWSLDPFQCTCGMEKCHGVISGFQGLSDTEMSQNMHMAEPDVREAFTAAGHTIFSASPYICVRANGSMGQATFATKSAAVGTCVFSGTGLLIPFPTTYTICLREGVHLLFADGGQCLAHSCDPNVKIVVNDRDFHCVAIKPIAAGDIIAFNYLTTEYIMNTPFHCVCGSDRCFGYIAGFKNVPLGRRAELAAQLTGPVRCMAERELGTIVSVGKSTDAGEVIFEGCTSYIFSSNVVRFNTGVSLPHSCDPNTVLVEGRIVAARHVPAGTPLTVNFNLFEYSLDAPFECECSASTCCKIVTGFRGLPDSVKQAKLYLSEPKVRADAMEDGFIVRSASSLIHIRKNGGMGQTAFAASAIPAGTKLFHCPGLVVPFITMYTICIREGRHVLFGQGAECIPHHCDPNVKVVTCADDASFDFVVTRDIAEGEMVSFNYLSSEWRMNTPFDCLCGSEYCCGRIHGFQNVKSADRERMQPLCTAFVRRMLSLEAKQAVIEAPRRFLEGEVIFEGCTSYTFSSNVVRFNTGVSLPHSCDPNTVLVEGRIVAARHVPAGTPLTVNFNLFEYSLDAPFECKCAASQCLGTISGFSSLPLPAKMTLMHLAEPCVREAHVANGFPILSSFPAIEVRANGSMGQATFATRDIAMGELVGCVGGLLIPFPTTYTIFLGHAHLLFAGGPQCLAHSCDPNVKIVVNDRDFHCVAIKPIAAGDIIAFNYLTTEYIMNTPFHCVCGSDRCFGYIAGFGKLPLESRQVLRSQVTTAVASLEAREVESQ